MAYSFARANYAPSPLAAQDISSDEAFVGRSAGRETCDAVAFRQLRHQTKNALQRLICEISRNADQQTTEEGRLVFEGLERRIFLTARISDALFGLTSDPGPIERRLNVLADGMIGLLGADGQEIDCKVRVDGVCPKPLEDTVLRVAHEMIGNAIKHGLAGRSEGRVTIRFASTSHLTVLRVIDDGPDPAFDETGDLDVDRPGADGFGLMRALAAGHGGCVSLTREGSRTVAELRIPGVVAAGFSARRRGGR